MGAVYCERSFTAADPYRITFATRDPWHLPATRDIA